MAKPRAPGDAQPGDAQLPARRVRPMLVQALSGTSSADSMTPSLRATERFELVKWYLDAVEPDGSATIAYWASLGWLGIGVTWHNATRYPLGHPPREQTSL